MNKILFISNLTNKIDSFAIASIAAAKSLDLDFYHAANWKNGNASQIKTDELTYGIKISNVPISRNPFSASNIKAYKELVSLVKREKIDIIHCNTPTGGLLGRFVGMKCKVKKVIYQAHGFHFYKGAPKKNWLLYYPIEKWLARYTDALITINREDYEFAKNKLKLRNGGKVYYVPGVGIDSASYQDTTHNKENKRRELELNENDVALISMGDLIARKNYATSLEAIAKTNNPNLHYFICGRGPEEHNLKMLSEQLGIGHQVHFLGFRSDIKELLRAADIFLFSTKQEGLPRSMMEAMASGLPCIASNIRGNIDLIAEGKGGFLCTPTDSDAFAGAINALAADDQLCQKMSEFNLNRIKDFDVTIVREELRKIYCKIGE